MTRRSPQSDFRQPPLGGCVADDIRARLEAELFGTTKLVSLNRLDPDGVLHLIAAIATACDTLRDPGPEVPGKFRESSGKRGGQLAQGCGSAICVWLVSFRCE